MKRYSLFGEEIISYVAFHETDVFACTLRRIVNIWIMNRILYKHSKVWKFAIFGLNRRQFNLDSVDIIIKGFLFCTITMYFLFIVSFRYLFSCLFCSFPLYLLPFLQTLTFSTLGVSSSTFLDASSLLGPAIAAASLGSRSS